MTKDDPSGANAGTNPDRKPAAPRRSHTIRFSDSEWNRVETAANAQAIPAAEFVRDAALSLAGGKSGEDSGNISPGIVSLVESTYRYAYILATLKRNEMIREQRGNEVNEMVRAARESQSVLLNQASQ